MAIVHACEARAFPLFVIRHCEVGIQNIPDRAIRLSSRLSLSFFLTRNKNRSIDNKRDALFIHFSNVFTVPAVSVRFQIRPSVARGSLRLYVVAKTAVKRGDEVTIGHGEVLRGEFKPPCAKCGKRSDCAFVAVVKRESDGDCDVRPNAESPPRHNEDTRKQPVVVAKAEYNKKEKMSADVSAIER